MKFVGSRNAVRFGASAVRRLRLPAAFVAGAVLAGGFAYAAIPTSANGQIVACYRKVGGALRVIDTQKKEICDRKNETQLSWQSAGLRWRGVWDPAKNYSANDVVTSLGSSYVAISGSKNVDVAVGSKWALLAAQGAPGLDGRDGAPGQDGAPGPQGPQGPSGPSYGRQITSSSVIDTTGTFFTSVAIGVDGSPVISYYDGFTRDLNIAICSDPACLAAPVIRVPDSVGDVGEFSSVAIRSDGSPVVAYYDATNTSLKLFNCPDQRCNIGVTNVPLVLEGAVSGDVGKSLSLTIGADGSPVIAYADTTTQGIRLLVCSDALCSAHVVVTVPDTAWTGATATDGSALMQITSVSIGADGNPFVAYYARPDGNHLGTLKALICADPACVASSIRTLDSTTGSGAYPSVAFNANGNPLVSYYDEANQDLKVVVCGDPTCSTVNPPVTMDSAGDVGTDGEVVIGMDGLPMVAYRDAATWDLKLVKCLDALCASQSASSVLAAGSLAPSSLSLAIGEAGRPTVSYFYAGTCQSLAGASPCKTDWRIKVAVVAHTGWAPNDWGR